MPNLRKPVFAVMVWWNSWSLPMHRRRPKDSVVNAVAEMKNFACFCMYHGYPLFPLFLGWVGDITRDIPVCFLTCPLNVVPGAKKQNGDGKTPWLEGNIGATRWLHQCAHKMRQNSWHCGGGQGGQISPTMFAGYLKDTLPPPPQCFMNKRWKLKAATGNWYPIFCDVLVIFFPFVRNWRGVKMMGYVLMSGFRHSISTDSPSSTGIAKLQKLQEHFTTGWRS